jgi:hypothetical protein
MKRTINDHGEDIHLKLIEDEHYNDLLSATCNAESVEGTMWTDDRLAALMIQDYARRSRHTEVANAKLRAIVRALHVVQRRYGMSRKQRAALNQTQQREPAPARQCAGFLLGERT